MKTFYALLIASLFTTAACKKKDEPAKADPAAKMADPAKTDTAKMADPATATPDPVKTAEPAVAAAGGGMTVDEAGKKSNEIVDKMVKAFTDGGDDCDKIGANLKAMTADVKAMAAGAKEFDKDPAKKKEFDDKYGKGLQTKMEPMAPKLQKCMTNADVKAFFESLAS